MIHDIAEASGSSRRPPVPVLPRWLKIATPLLILAVIAFHITYIKLWPWGMYYQIDLQVYRAAGDAVLHGGSLYDHGLIGKLKWVYAPLGAAPFVPLAMLSLHKTRIVWVVVNMVVLSLSVVRCWRFLGYRRGGSVLAMVLLTIALSTVLEPVRTTFFLGQINIVLMAVVLWDLLRVKDSRWIGIGVGIAAGIKLTPLIFIPYLLLTRRYRAAAVAGGTFVATIALGFAVAPQSSWAYWIQRKFSDTSRISSINSPANQSLRGWLARLVSPPSATQALWAVLVLAFAALGLAAAVLAYRRGQELLSVALIGMCSTAVSPFSWDHHWVWFVPLSIYFLHRALVCRRPEYWMMTAFVYVAGLAWPAQWSSMPRNTTVSPATGLDSLDWAGEGITRNIYVITFLVTAIFAVVHFRRSTIPEAADATRPREVATSAA